MIYKYNEKTSRTMKSMIGLLAFLSKMMRMSLIDFNMKRMKQKMKFWIILLSTIASGFILL